MRVISLKYPVWAAKSIKSRKTILGHPIVHKWNKPDPLYPFCKEAGSIYPALCFLQGPQNLPAKRRAKNYCPYLLFFLITDSNNVFFQLWKKISIFFQIYKKYNIFVLPFYDRIVSIFWTLYPAFTAMFI